MNDGSGPSDEAWASPAANQITFQVLVLVNGTGSLSKQISLVDGVVKSDGSTCKMSVGRGAVETHTINSFALRLPAFEPNQALALGSVREGVPKQFRVETKWSERTIKFDGPRPNDLIARSQDYIKYRPGTPALALLDVDTKGMSSEIRDRIRGVGGYWQALLSILPELATAGRRTAAIDDHGAVARDHRATCGGLGWPAYIYPDHRWCRCRAVPEDAASAGVAGRFWLGHDRCRRHVPEEVADRCGRWLRRKAGVRGAPAGCLAAYPGSGAAPASRDRRACIGHARCMPRAECR